MTGTDTPGIRFERQDSSGGGIAALRTDVAGFVGIARRGPLHLAVPVESMRQFEAWFGGQIDTGYLAYSARAFFENGGRRLWAVRVASPAASAAWATLYDGAGPAWRIAASSTGVWGNAIGVTLSETRKVQRRATLDPLFPDRLRTDNVAGLDRATLIEVRSESARERAVILDADPVTGLLRLDRALTLVEPYRALRVESIAYTVAVFDMGRLMAQVDDVSTVPAHPRYGPALLRQPWVHVDPDRPDQWTGNRPEADVAVDYFRLDAGRGAIVPSLVVVEELRDRAARDSLSPFAGTASGPAGPLVPVTSGAPVLLSGGGDGLSALTRFDFTGEALAPDASPAAIAAARRGMAALEMIEEVALVAVPDIHIRPRIANPVTPPAPCIPDPCLPGVAVTPPVAAAVGDLPPLFTTDQIALVQLALVGQCERLRDRIALLDAPYDACTRPTFAASDLREWRSRFDTPFAALYAPWVKVSDPLRPGGGLIRAIPPSGHVAGHAAAVDLRAGVHVAPANIPLLWVQGVTLDVTEALHGLFNGMGVNVLRTDAGRGLRVLGARTLSSDPSWRYVNVRRLVSMIAEAIEISIQWAVFEPNDWRTQAKLRLAVESFLLALWSRGALAGATPGAGFRVRCDASNNPPAQRDLGQLLMEVDIAPTVPFEFITLRIGREASGFAVSAEQTALAA